MSGQRSNSPRSDASTHDPAGFSSLFALRRCDEGIELFEPKKRKLERVQAAAAAQQEQALRTANIMHELHVKIQEAKKQLHEEQAALGACDQEVAAAKDEAKDLLFSAPP